MGISPGHSTSPSIDWKNGSARFPPIGKRWPTVVAPGVCSPMRRSRGLGRRAALPADWTTAGRNGARRGCRRRATDRGLVLVGSPATASPSLGRARVVAGREGIPTPCGRAVRQGPRRRAGGSLTLAPRSQRGSDPGDRTPVANGRLPSYGSDHRYESATTHMSPSSALLALAALAAPGLPTGGRCPKNLGNSMGEANDRVVKLRDNRKGTCPARSWPDRNRTP